MKHGRTFAIIDILWFRVVSDAKKLNKVFLLANFGIIGLVTQP